MAVKAAPTFDLSGQVAVVTGGALGIGQALSEGLVSAGAAVAVIDLPTRHQEAQSLCQRLETAGGWARFYPLDVCHTASIAGVFDTIHHDFGRFDILVNNAGTGYSGDALDVTPQDWDRIQDVNLKAVFFCAQAAARLMVAQGGGTIINMCSTHALIALPGGAPYIASKGGVASLTRSLALEWIRLGVRVNAIAPGPVDTDYKRQADLRLGRTEDSIHQDMQARIPLGRRLQPEELVGAALLLASTAGQAMVGHVLVVDGGQVIH